jgi:hypothetical protein
VFIADLGEGSYAKRYRMVMDKNVTEHPAGEHGEHSEGAHE